MGDQAALQEAIQRARQLAAKITQNQPVKRPASSIDHSGPVKVTLAYEKPANSSDNTRHDHQSTRQRSSSRDYDRNERDPRDSRDLRSDSKERYSSRDNNYNRDSRDRDSSSHRINPNSSISSHGSGQQYEISSGQPPPPMSRSGAEEKIEIIIPCAVIGLVIGKGGENIKRIQNESGATVRVDPNTVDEKGNKLCTIIGTKNAVENARVQVENVIENAATNKRPRMQVSEGSDCYRMKIPASRTGAIIGKGGETIKSIKQQSDCEIELDKGAKDCGPDESLFILRGSQDKIMKARSLIEARLAVGRDVRDRGGPRDHQVDHHSGARQGTKGVATGANAAPVGQYPDMRSSYPANPPAAATAAVSAGAGQHNSADMTAAWAAYFAQYSTLFNQTGGQPTTPSMQYPGQPAMMGALPSAAPSVVGGQPIGQMDQQHQQAPKSETGPQGGQAQDFSDQWIEYYLANGRPDYAEQIIQMKKQQGPK